MTPLPFPKDPLLATARVILKVMEWGAVTLGTLGLLVAAIAWWNADKLVYAMAHSTHVIMINGDTLHPQHIGPDLITGMAILLVFSAAMSALLWFFARQLSAIVGTVSAGDPFVPENAVRLRRMGWVMLAVEVVGAPVMEILAGRLSAVAGDGGVQFRLDGTGLLTVLTLFILARVFRVGAAMRQDLEGTV